MNGQPTPEWTLRDRSAVSEWNHSAFRIRVRGAVNPQTTVNYFYLWGSAQISQALPLPASLLLHIRNDEFGQPIKIGTSTPNTPQSPLGALNPGESFSIPLQGLSGVYATCAGGLQSWVWCSIRNA